MTGKCGQFVTRQFFNIIFKLNQIEFPFISHIETLKDSDPLTFLYSSSTLCPNCNPVTLRKPCKQNKDPTNTLSFIVCRVKTLWNSGRMKKQQMLFAALTQSHTLISFIFPCGCQTLKNSPTIKRQRTALTPQVSVLFSKLILTCRER